MTIMILSDNLNWKYLPSKHTTTNTVAEIHLKPLSLYVRNLKMCSITIPFLSLNFDDWQPYFQCLENLAL